MESQEYFIPILTVLGMFLANGALIIPLFLWNRSESRADIRHMDAKLEADIRHMDDRLESIRELVKAIYDESRDFHARLCKIEENRK